MSVREHLEGIRPGLYGDCLERVAIRIEDGGQGQETAMREAYRETCRRVGEVPRIEQRQMCLIGGGPSNHQGPRARDLSSDGALLRGDP